LSGVVAVRIEWFYSLRIIIGGSHMKPKKEVLTGWFPPNVKPVHAGTYETWFQHPLDLGYTYWNGQQWSGQSKTREQSCRINFVVGIQWKHWRGLAEPKRRSHHAR